MNRPVEQALFSLLPTLNTTVPQPLLELADSLLAQSRHKASTLKPEEEIARPYACAHIACNRLKISLNLPPIEPRPPVPPRIYKRLYSHLDQILPGSTTPGRSTPKRNRIPSAKLRDQGIQPGNWPSVGLENTTPSKRLSLESPSHSASQKPKLPVHRRTAYRPATSDTRTGNLPAWIRPSLRLLCKELENSAIGPIVMAAIETIVMPHGRRTNDPWVMENLSSLLGSLFLYVWASVTMPRGLDESRYVSSRKRIVETLNGARSSVILKEDVSENEGLEGPAWWGWKEICVEDIDDAALWVNRHGWLESDWSQGIEDLIRANERHSDHQYDQGDVADYSEYRSVKRADTMFQERYDFLSHRKRREYAVWKEQIAKRIQALQSAPGSTLDS
ncbi:hypothetical protein VTK73DRAFT_4155 [Phialemonium thermophilum]|uniref:ORC6 first cyclin-like domain-containing protein n=1 Tax=Phialemonium thermophilum TaxID=223376 RepID=A0ABR3XZD5_9PEZI